VRHLNSLHNAGGEVAGQRVRGSYTWAPGEKMGARVRSQAGSSLLAASRTHQARHDRTLVTSHKPTVRREEQKRLPALWPPLWTYNMPISGAGLLLIKLVHYPESDPS
jgi:hypothetical protein